MKVLVALAAVAVVLQSVAANGGGGGGGGEGSQGGAGSLPSLCRCSTRSNPCHHNTNGTQLTGCRNSNKYVQCVNTTCSPLTCAAGQLWNQTSKSCYSCPTGYHVNVANTTCVCNNGTTLTIVKPTSAGQRPTFTCGKCPTGATQFVDSCRCVAPLLLNEASNACQACPTGSTLLPFEDECSCTDKTQFWNESTWSCVPCPSGSVLVTPKRGEAYCNCTGANQIFLEDSVSCYTCPQGSTAEQYRYGDECQCPRGSHQEFSFEQGGCVCEWGWVMNTATNTCVRQTTSTTTKP